MPMKEVGRMDIFVMFLAEENLPSLCCRVLSTYRLVTHDLYYIGVHPFMNTLKGLFSF